MAIPLEGYSVVAQLNRISHLLKSNEVSATTRSVVSDGNIWRRSFMAEEDARKFLQELQERNVNVQFGPDPDAVLVNEFDQSIEPHCSWLSVSTYEKAVIGWRTGTDPNAIVAYEDWDPKAGSGLIFHDPEGEHDLEFVRAEDNIVVYLDRSSGEEVYVGRSSPPILSLFEAGRDTILKHFYSPGDPIVTGSAAEEIADAIDMLSRVTEEDPDAWGAHWFLGKGLTAVGRYEEAYQSFHRALELERDTEAIGRELAGVCLELKKYDEAVTVAEQAAALKPDDHTTLGNLALCYLFAGRLHEARKTILAARKLHPANESNNAIAKLIEDVTSGMRALPETISELSAPKPKRTIWQRLFFWRS
ncbi:MAG: tetratricopeptide repeat protein [Planctomycetales bacterium]|nr:tetratricopeptide repeat protein [Planctomycetales bacterium]